MKKSLKILTAAFVSLFCIVSLSACNAAEQYFVYNTFLDVSAEGAGSIALLDKIYEYAKQLERAVSPTVEGSDVYKINAAGEGDAVACSALTMQIMRAAWDAYIYSDGAYDPTVYPLVRLWSFSGDTFSKAGAQKEAPSQTEISDALSLVGLSRAFEVDYEKSTVTKKSGYGGSMLDFGGVAKGFFVQQALQMANKNQKLIVNLGGNIGGSNKNYSVAVGNPRASSEAYFGIFTLEDGFSASTSGDYERYYTLDNPRNVKAPSINDADVKTYCHIINPFTGYPVDFFEDDENTLVSATVVMDDGALGDALSTAVFVLGKEEGTLLLERLGIKGVLVDSQVHYTVINGLDFVRK
jgi:thiamine biosynthesis lipoprotein